MANPRQRLPLRLPPVEPRRAKDNQHKGEIQGKNETRMTTRKTGWIFRTAAVTSSGPASWTEQMTSSVAGSTVSKVLPDLELTNSLLMNKRVSNLEVSMPHDATMVNDISFLTSRFTTRSTRWILLFYEANKNEKLVFRLSFAFSFLIAHRSIFSVAGGRWPVCLTHHGSLTVPGPMDHEAPNSYRELSSNRSRLLSLPILYLTEHREIAFCA